MLNKVTGIAPNGYEISAKYSHTLDDKSEQWTLDFKEFYTEEAYKSMEEDTIELFKKIDINPTFDNENLSVHYTIQGPRSMILSMLASEFLFVSPFGEMNLRDLVFSLMHSTLSTKDKTPEKDKKHQ